MPIPLKRPYYEVLASILKSHRGARRDIRWDEFEKAVGALGFVARRAGGGSKRTFECTGPWARIPFSLNKPKNHTLHKGAQDSLKTLFATRYGWHSATFKRQS
ncbi:hypothetical protein OH77DRAFT_1420542 [Trametes cingulata]|nr:hypothetical protein OH77DRAFT_1420542 [Trametes cingulata]